MNQNPLTDEQLNQIEARANAATQDPWLCTETEDVRVLLAEVRRQRAELADAEAEKAKLIRWHGEDEKALARMRGVIERLRAEMAATRTKTLTVEADEIVAHCPDHGSKDGAWMDCHCAVADDIRRRTATPAPAVSGGE